MTLYGEQHGAYARRMARIVEHFSVPVPPSTAFGYVADFTNTRDWDPMIDAARRVDSGPLGIGSSFEVALRFGSRTVPLVYTITVFEPDAHVVLETEGSWYRGRDDVRIRPAGEGSEVQWDATFTLRGPLRLIDPLMGVGFRRTAAKAVDGLRSALGGRSEPGPARRDEEDD
jgi:carbon monoxide dehydrogenase subunit G